MSATGPWITDLQSWLDDHGLGQYAQVLAGNDIGVDLLAELTDEELRELGFSIGHRMRLRRALQALDCAVTGSAPERRQLTVMFCDLVGSTELSVRLDPEDLREVIQGFRERCIEVIGRYHGHVARFMGDGILVYFGYPQADENDPERALRAGLDITATVRLLRSAPGAALQVRVGIATGEVVVGDLLEDGFAREQAVVGQTPNLAARLQGLAEPGWVVASEETRRRVAGLFEWTDLGPQALKGFAEPISAWRVVRERSVESRFDAMHSMADLPPLVGREAQRALLEACWQRARSGTGQVVMLSGEAGIGKSRLAHALRETLQGEAFTLLRYHCLPYYQDTPLHPIIKQMQWAARLAEEDTDSVKLDKLEALLGTGPAASAEMVPLVAALMSVPYESRHARLDLSPELILERTLQALTERFLALSTERPVLAVFEDLHWIDPVTLALIARTVPRIAGSRLMLVATHRPDFTDPFGEASHVTRLRLERLEQSAGHRLIANLTGAASFPETWAAQILTRSDGVPLFIEELTRTLIETGATAPEDGGATSHALPVTLPVTLQDSLMARLDRLGRAKTVAQVGAVIGRQFSRELLREVLASDARTLDADIERLHEADLIRRTRAAEGEWLTFRHALVQDAAYASLLRERRRGLHAQVAAALEAQHAAIVSAEPELLARHHIEAGQGQAAIPYLHRAAAQAASRAAHAQASHHLRTALELTGALAPGERRDRLELAAQVQLAASLAATRGYAAPGVVGAYERARVLCEQLGQSVDRFPILSGLVSYYLVRGEHRTSQRIAAQCLAIAAQSGQTAYCIDADRVHGYTQFFLGHFDSARASLERSLDAFAAHRDAALEFASAEHPAAAALALLPLGLWFLGRTTQARARAAEGEQLAERLGHPYNVAFVHTWYAVFRQLSGEPEAAARHAARAVELSSAHGFQWLGPAALHLTIAQTTPDTAASSRTVFEQTLTQFEAAGAGCFISYFQAALARMHAAAGAHEAALQAVEQAIAHSDAHHELFYRAQLHLLRAELLAPYDARRAHADLERAVMVAREQGALAVELRALLALGHHADGAPPATRAATAARLRELCRHCDIEPGSTLDAKLRSARGTARP